MKKKLIWSALATIGVLTPTLASITSCNNANKSKLSEEDINYLNSINAVVATLDFEGVPFKAVHAVKNAGYNLFEHKFSNPEFQLVLNMEDKAYALLHNDILLTPNKTITTFDKNKVWKFVDKYDPKSPYAQHLNDNFKWDSSQTLEVTGCVDTGTNTNVKKIKYVGTIDPKTVYLRTYTEILIVEPLVADTIHHFHYADNVFVTGTGDSHYLEYGRSCYLRANSTKLSFTLTQARDEPSSIDVFEPVGNQTVQIVEHKADAKVYTKLGNGTTKGTVNYVYPNLQTVSVTTWAELKAISASCCVRLENDINLTTEDTWGVGTGGAVGSTNVVLDLNGHSINTSNVALNNGLPVINVINGTLIIMDSQATTNRAKITGNQHIKVAGLYQTDLARLIVNGGQIDFTTWDANRASAAITVGDTSVNPSTANDYRSEFYLYGGSISSVNKTQSEELITPAIKVANKSSYIYTVYGDIYGTDGAIVTDDGGTTPSSSTTNGAVIEVFGGNFASDDKHICINLRQQSIFTVYGGSFTGGTVIGCINSELILNGGVFNATGEVVKDFYKTQTVSNNYLLCDGSVIACYWHTDKSTQLSATAQPNIISNNVKMYSAKGNILHIGSENFATPTPKNWIEFISGCYYYSASAQEAEYPAGMLFATGFVKDNFEWLQKGLWTARK